MVGRNTGGSVGPLQVGVGLVWLRFSSGNAATCERVANDIGGYGMTRVPRSDRGY